MYLCRFCTYVHSQVGCVYNNGICCKFKWIDLGKINISDSVYSRINFFKETQQSCLSFQWDIIALLQKYMLILRILVIYCCALWAHCNCYWVNSLAFYSYIGLLRIVNVFLLLNCISCIFQCQEYIKEDHYIIMYYFSYIGMVKLSYS